jgi:predicted Zn finger-like uncharacterized protein
MSLVVTCPSCGTVFSMVREQLEVSGGRVRCGHCMEVFDAQMQLAQMDDLDREHRTQHLQEDIAAPAQSNVPHTDLSFVQQAKKEQFWASPLVRFVLTLSTITLFALLSAQLLRTEHARALRLIPSTAPIIQKLCELVPCTTAERRQIDGWLIENSSFQKEGANSFRLTATLKNTSTTTLLIPQVELNLLDSGDGLLVRHVISSNPDEPTALASGIAHSYTWLVSPQASSTANVRLSSKDIVGYRLVLFYP